MVKMCKIDILEDCADGSGEDSLPQNRDFPASSKSRHNSPLSFVLCRHRIHLCSPLSNLSIQRQRQDQKRQRFFNQKSPKQIELVNSRDYSISKRVEYQFYQIEQYNNQVKEEAFDFTSLQLEEEQILQWRSTRAGLGSC